MNILAIDPAEKTGWATNAGNKDVEWGMWDFKLKRDENFAFKLIRFKAKLEEAIKKYKIDLLVFERVSGVSSVAIMSHAKFVGVMEVMCTESGLPFKGYSAGEIKKHATGKGNAGKKEMLKKAIKDYGYRGKDDNEADAICLLKFAEDDI